MIKPSLKQVQEKLEKIRKAIAEMELVAPNARWLKKNKRYRELKEDRDLFNKKVILLRRQSPIKVNYPYFSKSQEIMINSWN